MRNPARSAESFVVGERDGEEMMLAAAARDVDAAVVPYHLERWLHPFGDARHRVISRKSDDEVAIARVPGAVDGVLCKSTGKPAAAEIGMDQAANHLPRAIPRVAQQPHAADQAAVEVHDIPGIDVRGPKGVNDEGVFLARM